MLIVVFIVRTMPYPTHAKELVTACLDSEVTVFFSRTKKKILKCSCVDGAGSRAVCVESHNASIAV